MYKTFNKNLSEDFMYNIDRSAVILTPKEPFLTWLNSVEQDGNQWSLNEIRSDPTVYLIPSQETEVRAAHYINSIYSELFNRVLEEWIMEKELWPKELTLDMFYDWFDIYFYSSIIDTDAAPIQKDEIF